MPFTFQKKYNYYKKIANKIKNKKSKYNDFNKIINVIEHKYNFNLHLNQIIAALALIDGKIIDMKTGEGKTLSGILAAAYLATKNKKVHIISANDYLVERDFLDNKEIFESLNISTGMILRKTDFKSKKEIYNKDVVFVTSQVLCLDYLLNLHTYSNENQLNISLDHIIIDEADVILLDQANLPVIKTKTYDENLNIYKLFNDLIKLYNHDDFDLDELTNTVRIKESGFLKLENYFIENKIIDKYEKIYNNFNVKYLAYLENAIKANFIMKKDFNYSIIDGNIIIIDSETGRLLTKDQRWSNGLHQAIEAKENIEPKSSNIIETSITYQNFFKKYKKISAMSGTSISDKNEYKEVFNLDIIVIPQQFKNLRKINPDYVFIKNKYRLDYLLNMIKDNKERPILISTTSVKESEVVSEFLTYNNVIHSLINAKNPEDESNVIKNAGQLNTITVTTNISGRGTDIKLGNDQQSKQKIIDMGGLLIISLGKGKTKRVDDQLSGRCARQGDTGEIQFLLCFEDELAKTLPIENFLQLFKLLGIQENEAISNKQISQSFEIIQNKISSNELEGRKTIILFDDIIESQRNIFYDFRKKILETKDFDHILKNISKEWVNSFLNNFFKNNINEDQNKVIDLLKNNLIKVFQIEIPLDKIKYNKILDKQHINEINLVIEKAFSAKYNYIKEFSKKINNFDINNYIKTTILYNLDEYWSEYFYNLEELKLNVKLRAIANKKPIDEFTNDSYILFKTFIDNINFQLLNLFLTSSHLLKFQEIIKKQNEKEKNILENKLIEDNNDN